MGGFPQRAFYYIQVIITTPPQPKNRMEIDEPDQSTRIDDIRTRFLDASPSGKEAIVRQHESTGIMPEIKARIIASFFGKTDIEREAYLKKIHEEVEHERKTFAFGGATKMSELKWYEEALSEALLMEFYRDNKTLDKMAAAFAGLSQSGPHLRRLYGAVSISLVVNLGNLIPGRNESTILLPMKFINLAHLTSASEMYDIVVSSSIDYTYDIMKPFDQSKNIISALGLYWLGQYLRALDNKMPTPEEYEDRPAVPAAAEMQVFDSMRWAADPGYRSGGYKGFVIPIVRDTDGPASPFLEFWNIARFWGDVPHKNVWLLAIAKYVAYAAMITPKSEHWRLFNLRADYVNTKEYERDVALSKVHSIYYRTPRLNNMHLIDEDYKKARKWLGADEADELARSLKIVNLPPGVEDSDDEGDRDREAGGGNSSSKTRGRQSKKGDAKRNRVDKNTEAQIELD